jgi:transposase
VRELVAKLDLKSVEARYSSLGRHGYQPTQVLAVWIYASLIGLHDSTKVAHALETDAALRWLAGGYAISAPTLRRFRQRNAEFFAKAIETTVALAQKAGMLKLDELSVDSVRLRANASMKAVRTVERSKKRLQELAAVDLAALGDDERRKHEAKVAKHRAALEQCAKEDRANIVVTNPAAGFIHFPTGGSAPGHRVTVTASGVRARLVVSVLIDAGGHDYGKAGPALEKVRAVLQDLGIEHAKLKATADAGYFCEADLAFAAENEDWVDLLIATRNDGYDNPKYFGRDRFTIDENGKATCPAGTQMQGPWKNGKEGYYYEGRGCGTCVLKPQCTPGQVRAIKIKPKSDATREAMRQRMADPECRARYNKRIATVEPVFSYIEASMGFRRVTTRQQQAITAEILLKVLAYNLSRLLAGGVLEPATVVVLLPELI